MARSRKKRNGTGRGKVVALILFVIGGGALFWGRHELMWGLKGYVVGKIDFLEVEDEEGLPAPSEVQVRPTEAMGIPDYKNPIRFPYEGKTLTCYRMVGFRDRLVVCSDKGLKRPEAIGEIIKERSIRGRLERLNKSQMNDSLRRIFLKASSIRLAEDAFLLYEDPAPLPSKVKVGFLAFCVVVCCFSAYRLIK
jgi:hypothetical protein